MTKMQLALDIRIKMLEKNIDIPYKDLLPQTLENLRKLYGYVFYEINENKNN